MFTFAAAVYKLFADDRWQGWYQNECAITCWPSVGFGVRLRDSEVNAGTCLTESSN